MKFVIRRGLDRLTNKKLLKDKNNLFHCEVYTSLNYDGRVVKAL